MSSFAPASTTETTVPVVLTPPKAEVVSQESLEAVDQGKEPPEDIEPSSCTPDELTLLESLYQSYLRFLKASKDQAQAAKDLSAAQAAFDECQGETKGAKEAFEVILKSLPDELVRIRDPQSQAMIDSVREMQAVEQVASKTQGSSAGPNQAIATSESYEAWKALPTQRIVDIGVPGLGKKKVELLIEKFPTIGDLEAARADAAGRGIHWSKLLPKGFGRDVSDAIYDAMAKIPMKSGTSKVGITSDGSQDYVDSDDSREPSLAVDPEPSPPEVSDIDPDDELQYEDLDSEDDDVNSEYDEVVVTFEQKLVDRPKAADARLRDEDDSEPPGDSSIEITALEWIESLYNEITEDTAEQKKLWGLNQTGKNSTEWEKGRKAQEDGFEIADCPYGRDREQAARDWLRGWIAASMNMDL